MYGFVYKLIWKYKFCIFVTSSQKGGISYCWLKFLTLLVLIRSKTEQIKERFNLLKMQLGS